MADEQIAGIGDNHPPPDPFIAKLEENHAGLTERFADLEIARRRLPREVKTAEDVAAINAHVIAMRALAGAVEAKRVEVKAPYLAREKTIDGWFGDFRRTLLASAAEIEKRSLAYLAALKAAEEKRAAEQLAWRRAQAEKAQREAAEAARVAQVARDAAAARARQIEAAAALSAAPGSAASEVGATPTPVPAEARVADPEADKAERVAAKAADAARIALAQVETAEHKAESPTLGRHQGGGASARIEMVWVAKFVSQARALQSLGWAAQVITEAAFLDLVQKASRLKERPEIPGVEWVQEPAVKTTASRKAS